MKMNFRVMRWLSSVVMLCFTATINAGTPLWTFTPLTATTLSVPSNSTAIVQYVVTNQSSKTHTLRVQPIQGMSQLTSGLGVCGNPFVLTGKASCVLSLQINGAALTSPINDGPIVCEQASTLQCYRPASADVLHITQASVVPSASISVSGSPLMLTANGSAGTLTITNNSLTVTATNIISDFTGTALDGNVTESGNTCGNVAPLASCTLTYVPGGAVVPQTNFTIQGSNTNTVTAAIEIESGVTLDTVMPSSGAASGGMGVVLIGAGLTGATSVTFGNIAATSINVINSTTVTAVTPAHSVGVVDVAITTPSGSATKTNGYTYVTTVVGQSAYGGIIACLNGGSNNLIASTADNSTGIEWGGFSTLTNATSTTDGAANTATIVAVLGSGGVPYGAQLCDNYEVDSQGNTPCESGNTCYNDWFLPAGNNMGASGQLNCLYTNRVSIGGFGSGDYWSSTEFNAFQGYFQSFGSGVQNNGGKNITFYVRCVRVFVP